MLIHVYTYLYMLPLASSSTPVGWIVGFDAFDAHEALCSLVASALSPLPRGSWRLVARPPHWPRLPTDFKAVAVRKKETLQRVELQKQSTDVCDGESEKVHTRGVGLRCHVSAS